jgi:hypothetical protein
MPAISPACIATAEEATSPVIGFNRVNSIRSAFQKHPDILLLLIAILYLFARRKRPHMHFDRKVG